MNGAPVALGVQANKVVVQNMGAKRIAGADLLTLGKVSQYMYYLEEIQSMCVYANDGTDTWIGAFGQVVAGSVSQRDNLSPFQGQRFYIVDTATAQEYKGSAWGGTISVANALNPAVNVLTAATSLQVELKYHLSSSATLKLPPADNSLAGNLIVLTTGVNTSGTLTSTSGTEQFFAESTSLVTSYTLQPNADYMIVFDGTRWNVVSSLQSFTAAEISALTEAAGGGVGAVGSTVQTQLIELFSTANSTGQELAAVRSIAENPADVDPSEIVTGVIATGTTLLEDLELISEQASRTDRADEINSQATGFSSNIVEDQLQELGDSTASLDSRATSLENRTTALESAEGGGNGNGSGGGTTLGESTQPVNQVFTRAVEAELASTNVYIGDAGTGTASPSTADIPLIVRLPSRGTALDAGSADPYRIRIFKPLGSYMQLLTAQDESVPDYLRERFFLRDSPIPVDIAAINSLPIQLDLLTPIAIVIELTFQGGYWAVDVASQELTGITLSNVNDYIPLYDGGQLVSTRTMPIPTTDPYTTPFTCRLPALADVEVGKTYEILMDYTFNIDVASGSGDTIRNRPTADDELVLPFTLSPGTHKALMSFTATPTDWLANITHGT